MPKADFPPRNILCILAGGESKRFGSSKLYIHIDGEPILAWQVRRLIGGVGKAIPGIAEAWMSMAPGERMALPGVQAFERRVADPVKHLGPLNGMWAVLQQARPNDTVAFVPADMPLLDEEHLTGLARLLAEDPDRAVVMGEWVDGPSEGAIEPMPSVWRAERGMWLLERARTRVRGPSGLADWEGVVCIGLKHDRDALAWTSVNQREDLLVVEKALGKRLTVLPPSPSGRGPG